MMQSPVRFLLLLIAACVAGIAAVLVLVPAAWEVPQPQLPAVSAVSIAALADEEAAVIDFEEVAARPLFVAGRRPWVAPVAVADPEPEPEVEPFPDAELIGIFGSGNDAGVIVSIDGKASRVRVGGEWSGWTLRNVGADGSSATFDGPGRRTHELKLKRQPQQGAMVYQVAEPEPASAPEAETQAKNGVAPADAAQNDAETTRPRRAANRNRNQREPSARTR